jgi:K+-sensing histidine kinase KdpD
MTSPEHRDDPGPLNLPPARAARAYGFAFLLVAAATILAEAIVQVFGITRLAPIFLAPVLIAAVKLGTRPAFFTAALAFLIYNFYVVQPRFTLSLDSPEEFLTLAMFLGLALMTGRLAGRVRDEAIHAKARARTLGALFESSRQLSSTDQEEALRGQLAHQIAAAAEGEAEVLYEGRSWRSGRTPDSEIQSPWASRVLAADGVELGLARWRSAGSTHGDADDVQGLVQVLVDVGAAAIARSRLAAEKAQVETVAKTERLRTALLSSISHDFRTPLTAILTSVSSLREFGDRFEPQIRDDLLSTIEEEGERLNRYVSGLLNMTKLESGALDVVSGPAPIGEILDRLMRRLQARAGSRRLRMDLDDKSLCARADPFLLEQALANVLENAVRFGPDGSLIEVRGAVSLGRVVLEIVDEGPGVPIEERERIFDKFYRAGLQTPLQPGTGLGLSIARGMIEAMNGQIWARDRPDGKTGLSVMISLAEMVDDED